MPIIPPPQKQARQIAMEVKNGPVQKNPDLPHSAGGAIGNN
jgi:hypothetical protein